jgi:1-acyl-sn-glycerol-3-phosphate acyltransferase
MRFLIGGITAGILTLVFFLFYIFSIPFDRRKRAFPFIAYWWSKGVFSVTGIKVKAVGLERIDLSKPYVYVSNHASLVDIPAVVVAINRYVRFVAKKEIARIPLFGWAAAHANIMVDRTSGPDSARSMEKAAGRIALGESVIMFAEGTRTRDGSMLPFKRGAFALAIGAGVPVVPLTILGSYDIMRKGKLRVRKGIVTIIVDPPVDVSEYHEKEGAIALMNKVRGIIERNYTTGGTAGDQKPTAGPTGESQSVPATNSHSGWFLFMAGRGE